MSSTPHARRSVDATKAGEKPRAADAAPPWDYNPSAWSQRLPLCVLAVVTGCIAMYMAAYQWRWVPTIWDPVFGDQTARVLDSDVSEDMRRWMLLPDAALGAVGYFSEAILGLAGSTRRWFRRPWLVILFGIDVIPLGVVSAVLVVLQGTVVGSWCFLCLITAVVSLGLVILAYDEVWSSVVYLRDVRRRTNAWRPVWDAFWGQSSEQLADAPAATRGDRQGAATTSTLGYWPRFVEMAIGVWLIAAPFVLPGPSPAVWTNVSIAAGAAIFLFAVLSFRLSLNKLHLLSIVVAVVAAIAALASVEHPAPAVVQNLLMTLFLAANFAIIPNLTASHRPSLAAAR